MPSASAKTFLGVEYSPNPLGIEPLTWQKVIPLGLMFFCILFNYTVGDVTF